MHGAVSAQNQSEQAATLSYDIVLLQRSLPTLSERLLAFT